MLYEVITGGGVGHWRVIAEAAQRAGKRSVRIEALEQLVQQADRRKQADAAVAELSYNFV